MNIDGTDLVLGRLASITAKKALLGETINVVHCEKVVISGSQQTLFKRIQHLREIGNKYNGPFIPRSADRYVRRVIKRMLPHKKPRGREAFKRVMCYVGLPPELENESLESVDSAHVRHLQTSKYSTVQQLCKRLGGK